jgi:hypothetical protein
MGLQCLTWPVQVLPDLLPLKKYLAKRIFQKVYFFNFGKLLLEKISTLIKFIWEEFIDLADLVE